MRTSTKWILIICLLVPLLAVVTCVIILAVSLDHEMILRDVPEFETAVRKCISARERSDVVISMTTMPERLNNARLKNSLACVLNQKPPPQAVHINVPYYMKRSGQKYVIPDWLRHCPCVTMVRCEDIGPATKYMSTLEYYQRTNPAQKICVIDDDMLMSPGHLKTMSEAMGMYPQVALCSHGMVLKNKGTEKVRFHLNHFCSSSQRILSGFGTFVEPKEGPEEKRPELIDIDILTGYQSYGVRPRMFDLGELADYTKLPGGAFFVDDVVISARLAERNIRRAVYTKLPHMSMQGSEIYEWLMGYIAPASPERSDLSITSNRYDTNNNDTVRHFWQQW